MVDTFNNKTIEEIIALGEDVNTEFKTGYTSLPKSVFETVCSFLNTTGGYIFLGIEDNGKIKGINPEFKEKIKKAYTTLCNNKEVINPNIISHLEEITINNKIVLYTYIEESSEIHKYKGRVYIRNYEGDFDISDNIPLITSIYNRKRKIYDEDEVYPHISVDSDLRNDLFDRCRFLVSHGGNKEHIWNNMNNLELLKSANLYKYDKETGKYGVTLAGIMLFGKDEVIRDINPYCRTDCLYRIDDLDRYDDRDFVETNLLDMYDRILAFITKHTLDRFALDVKEIRRISPRGIMAREMVINTLMHRDIRDGHTSRIIIYKDKIICENPNSFRTMKNIDIKNYTPFTKNPTLAKFFKEIGYADELGSGVRRITENSLLYSGKLPIFEDKEMFRLTIPLLRGKVAIEESNNLNKVQIKIINVIANNSKITKREISETINEPLRTVERNMLDLKNNNIIERVGSKKTGYWKLKNIKNNTSDSGGINGGLSGGINGGLNDIQEKIINVIANNNKITKREISETINEPLRTVERNMLNLKNNNIIERVGSNKTGCWKINN